MYDISLIKSRINCVTAAQRLGLPITQSGGRTVSPIRTGAKNKTSFWVDNDFWYDFGAARGGDVIDLWAEVKCDGDKGQAIRELAQITGVSPVGKQDQEWRDYTQALCNQIAFWQTQLTQEDYDYLHSRGLTDNTITALKIGRTEEGRLSIPYLKNGYVAYYCTRYLAGGKYPDSKYRKQKKDGFCEHIVWGLDTLDRDGDTLIIAEGAFDAISFWQEQYPVLSAITGHFSRDQIPTVLAAARKFKRVLLVYDNDAATHAGERFTERNARILLQAKIPFVVGTVPAPYHDISDYYAAGNKLDPIIANAQGGIPYLVRTYTNFEDLERFCYNLARRVKRTTLENVFTEINRSERFNSQAVKALYKSCTTAPPENIIADELMQSRQIIYVDAVGFYEYENGVWSRKSDNVIRGYADQAYGEFSTAQRVNAICNLLKTRCRRDVQFDRKPMWNFINGTLDLDTGLFRDHDPNDFCSIQATYPYNPTAECPAWQKFIHDVTADDPRTEELLQFIPAYALFHDCPHEKIFVLTGSGGNGKSQYLRVLGQLFGEENCSHLQPRALLDKFQAIQLRSSIINLAGEIKSDIRDAEEMLKMIASGEPISACYKGEQFITFSPRTKLVFACNGQLFGSDTSDGLIRRLVIVDFKMRFVESPDPKDPYQRKKDIYVGERLSEEVQSGAVFNWVYAGYKMLKTVGYFTETNDQEELLNDFRAASNPVLVFYDDEIKPNLTPILWNKQLYSDYQMWCVSNGYKAVSVRWFHREFRKVAQKEYEPFREANRRGYKMTLN